VLRVRLRLRGRLARVDVDAPTPGGTTGLR